MMRQLSVLVVGLLFCAVAFARPLPTVKPEREGFSADRLARITEITQSYVDEGKLAGVITMVARLWVTKVWMISDRLPKMICSASIP